MDSSEEAKDKEKLKAFEVVVSAYESALLRYATRLMHHHDSAQNIVQDVFIKLHKCWEHEMAPSPMMSNWLYRVTHNSAVDHMRKEKRLQVLHLKQAAESPKTVLPDTGDGVHVSDEAERAVELLAKLSLRGQIIRGDKRDHGSDRYQCRIYIALRHEEDGCRAQEQGWAR
jgi:RNA polymerase sigma factor (sigma-70 family)